MTPKEHIALILNRMAEDPGYLIAVAYEQGREDRAREMKEAYAVRMKRARLKAWACRHKHQAHAVLDALEEDCTP